VKRYASEKVSDEAGAWRHDRVRLSPVNPAYEPIELTPESEDEVMVAAEWVEVIKNS
jgi:SOS-response transcriptional repressor LexA